MSALLKIVQGPNAGAEIALPDGVEITVGTADTCDIVLADPTLPAAPMTLSATPGGVTLDGTPLEPFHVLLRGSTALAVGPADSPWSELVWPSSSGSAGGPPADPSSESTASTSTGGAGVPPAAPPSSSTPLTNPTNPTPTNPTSPKNPKPSRLLRLILLALAILLLLLLILFLARACHRNRVPPPPTPAEAEAALRQSLATFASDHNLVLDTTGPRPLLTANFPNRAERLATTAAAYSEFPGVALDFTDNETLRTAVADSLFTLGESGLTVGSVSDRTAVLAGTVDTPDALSTALDAIRADVPRLTGIDTAAVTFRTPAAATILSPDAPAAAARRRVVVPRPSTLPVCGILTTPYPCLVLQNGARVFPGATLGGSTVVSIAPDSVVLSNTNGTFTWKP